MKREKKKGGEDSNLTLFIFLRVEKGGPLTGKKEGGAQHQSIPREEEGERGKSQNVNNMRF